MGTDEKKEPKLDRILSLDVNGEQYKLIKETDYQQYETLKELAYTDPLTGLKNRRVGEDQIMLYLAQQYQYTGSDASRRDQRGGALLFMDLDHFKMINDFYGHDIGDQVLKDFADLLRRNSRKDDVLFRFGGDEFVLFYKGMTEEDNVRARCKTIIRQTKVLFESKNIPTFVSIGVAFVGKDGETFSDLSTNADIALRQCKMNNVSCLFSGEQVHDLMALGQLELTSIDRIESALVRSGNGSGAYIVTYREFQSLYQFVQRYGKRYGHSDVLLLIEVGSEGQDYEGGESGEHFENYIVEQIAKGLRQSDAVCRMKPGTFLVLLTNTRRSLISVVAERIRQNLEEGLYPVNCKMESKDV